ncbi:MAG TPA: alpha/beta fold hydrolase [Clostridia bacterium]|nr:alpha/beta fold hydrolase [Clostridia bacterium]
MLSEASLPQLPDWLRRLYPFQTRTLRLDGQALSFIDEGPRTAPVVVLLHGNPTWSFLYRKLIPKLAERFRVIAPDHIGFGLSDKPATPGYHSIERHAANLSALIESTGAKNVTLVLHDWGGPIGLAYATRNAANVSRMMLINTWAFPPPTDKQPRLPWFLRAMRGASGELLVGRLNMMVSPGIQWATRRKLASDVIDGYKFPFRDAATRSAMLAFARMIPLRPGDAEFRGMEQIADGLKNISARTDIFWGALDPVFRSKVTAYMLRDALPKATDPHFLAEASHFVPEDAPEKISDKLLEIFLPQPEKPVPLFNILR